MMNVVVFLYPRCTVIIDSIETWAAAVAAIVGGMGVKIVDKLLSKRSEAFKESLQIRDELRQGLAALRTELEQWKKEADQWRTKYWEQVEENVKLITDIKQPCETDSSPSGSL